MSCAYQPQNSLFQAKKRHGRRLLFGALVALSLCCVIWILNLHLSQLWSPNGFRDASKILSGAWPPEHQSDFLWRTLQLLLESVAIGCLGLLGALLLAIPLALFSAKLPDLLDPPARTKRYLYAFAAKITQLILTVFRAIPEIIWAYLFVRIFGLGPGPAVFAIALGFSGVIGKLFTEQIESCEPESLRSLRAAGVGRWGILLHAVLPQVSQQWMHYAWFRLECAIRSASVLGIVGAGGIGAEISLSIRYFQYDKLATALLSVLCVIILFEWLSRALRNQRKIWSLLLLGFSAALGACWLNLPWAALFESQTVANIRAFLVHFASPDWEYSFLIGSLEQMLQTILMAWFATICAALVAFLLVPWSTKVLHFAKSLPDAPHRRSFFGFVSLFLGYLLRFVFQVLRALPDLIWALLFVVWLGPGLLAGICAIVFHTIGVLGRLYHDMIQEIDLQPLQSLESHGVSAPGRWIFGVLPQVFPSMLSYTLFRFEVNVRTTAMMGFVGAGGIGDAIHTAISLFHFRRLATLLLLLFVTVALLDWIGQKVRHRILLAQWVSLTEKGE